MNMNQLILFFMYCKGQKQQAMERHKTYHEDRDWLVEKGLLQEDEHIGGIETVVSDKGRYTCARILEYATEGADAEYNGNPPAESDKDEADEDDTNWKIIAESLYTALEGILEIGRTATHRNPKYDGYYEAAKVATRRARSALKLTDEV